MDNNHINQPNQDIPQAPPPQPPLPTPQHVPINQNHSMPPQHHQPSPAQTVHSRSNVLNVVEKVEQLIIFVYFFIASILMFRFVLSLFGASKKSPFVDFVYQLTAPFMLPFQGMFGITPGVSNHRLEFEVLIGLVVYALIMFGLSRLVRIIFK